MHSSEFIKKNTGTLKEIFLLLILAGLVFLIYSSNLKGTFIFDDSRIENNAPLHITQLSLKNLATAGFESSPNTRPVAYITFALNYYFHGFHTTGYHLVNICIHILAAIFLFLLIKATLNLPPVSPKYGKYTWLPFAVALVWAVHPLQTQSVTYIIQRMNSLAAMFYILALYLYVRGRLSGTGGLKWLFFLCSFVAGVLSLGSKETAATLPFFIFLYEWYFLQDLDSAWLKKQVIPAAIIILLLGFLVLFYLGTDPIAYVQSSYSARNFSLPERLLTEFRVVFFYISLLLFPHPDRLNLDHHFMPSVSIVSPITTLLSVAALLALLGLAVGTAKKNRLFSFCILWFLGNLFIESSVIGLEIIFEHRNYLPSMMATLLIISYIFSLLHRHSWVRITIICFIVILLSFWTYDRNSVWNDKISLWSNCVAKSPEKARPHNNLGYALKQQGRLKEALAHYQQTVRIDPEFFEAYNNIGNIYMILGKFDKAIENYNMSLKIKPGNPLVHMNMGNAFVQHWQLEKALLHYGEAISLKPDFDEARLQFLITRQMIERKKARTRQ